MLSRRTFLLGALGTAVLAVGGAVAAIEDDALPGHTRLAALTGACAVDGSPAPGPVAAITTGRFASAARGREVGWSLAMPPGHLATGPPVALILHGRGGDHSTGFNQLKLHQFLAAYVRAGGTPFALAAVDGGDGYWHPRSDGDDPLRMVTEEFLPMLAKQGLATGTIGVLGWSMGGYGALLLAREANRGTLSADGASGATSGGTTIAAAAASSPALFASYRASASGAFDDAADFARYGDLLNAPDTGKTALFVGCGATDAFTKETRQYRANAAPLPAGGISKGCHTVGYWRSVAAAQIGFLGSHLA